MSKRLLYAVRARHGVFGIVNREEPTVRGKNAAYAAVSAACQTGLWLLDTQIRIRDPVYDKAVPKSFDFAGRSHLIYQVVMRLGVLRSCRRRLL
jgi:hypothetical protein